MELKILKDHSLKPYNTFGLEVEAKYFVAVESLELLKAALMHASKNQLTPFFLGGGSNVLLCNDLEYLVILNKIEGYQTIDESVSSLDLKIYSGTNWHQTVLYALENDWGGIENMSLIPGSVGAAPMQNIGAYGVELKDVFVELEALNLKTLELESFNKEHCQFGYRESVFKRKLKGQYFIYSVTLRLSKKDHQVKTSYGDIQAALTNKNISLNTASIVEVSNAIIGIRQSKLPDPKVLGNSGSFFKNPVITTDHFKNLKMRYPEIKGYQVPNGIKVPAGWLIERLGWKGKKVGQTGSHAKQALVLVNYGSALGTEVKDLAYQIIDDVKNNFGIQLEPEVNIIS